ncbi:MAG TPA: helix-turn-helix domain-containing protein [Chthoniobacterales bacterium]|jgi:hypothetical protein
MRNVKLTGREVSIVRVIGFAEAMTGAEILEATRMDVEDITDTLNGLMSAGFVESTPYREEVPVAEMPTTSFEINPAYVGDLRTAMIRR